MRTKIRTLTATAVCAASAVCLVGGAAAQAQQASVPGMAQMSGMPRMPQQGAPQPPLPAPGAKRVVVNFPPLVKARTLASMRMHLQGVAQIQQALADGDLQAAADIASRTLGMASMREGQAQEEARYMPEGMQVLGARLHHQAGEFALAAQDAQVTGDARKPMALLAQMTETCVACHATYRLR